MSSLEANNPRIFAIRSMVLFNQFAANEKKKI
jgi:hypothetical protein